MRKPILSLKPKPDVMQPRAAGMTVAQALLLHCQPTPAFDPWQPSVHADRMSRDSLSENAK